MILMLLDHIRWFLTNATFHPLDLTQTNVSLFLTRWITHLCAPTFIFLAGIGVYLSLKRGKTRKQLFYFLLIRGLWLIFLELTVVKIGWTFNLSFDVFSAGVLWAIGWSMIIVAPMIYLPVKIVGISGLILLFSHNLLDPISASTLGSSEWLWAILHEQKMLEIVPGIKLFVVYPLIPWIGVMAIGYAMGTIFELPEHQRRKLLQKIGISAASGFLILRTINIYGDPQPWRFQTDWSQTFLSFINCEKYPPSLQYLLLTLGISIFILGSLESPIARYLKPLAVFGQVPLFFYVIHIWVIHLAALILAFPQYGWSAVSLNYMNSDLRLDGYGLRLTSIYYIWIFLVLILYPICAQFNRYKKKNKKWLLNYL